MTGEQFDKAMTGLVAAINIRAAKCGDFGGNTGIYIDCDGTAKKFDQVGPGLAER